MKSLVVIAVLGVAGLIWMVATDKGDPDANVIPIAKDAVRAQTKDPDAVTFGDVWLGEVNGSKVACGTFNGKNSFGAYVGQQRFIASGDLVLTDQRAGRSLDGMWWDACEKHRP